LNALVALTSMAALALSMISGCTSEEEGPPKQTNAPSTTTSAASSRPATADSLVSLERRAAYEIPTGTQEIIADGALVFKNSSDFPVHIRKVKPVFEGGGSGLEVVGIKIAPLRSPGDEPTGIQRKFPPNKAVADRWQDAEGATVEPESIVMAYELIIGFRVQAGTHHVTGIQIEFEADNVAFQSEFSHNLTLCRMENPSSTAC